LHAAKLEFMELEKAGIVRRSTREWAALLHMVRKADGTWRPCGDYRRLNVQTTPDRYTCLNIADLTARLAGCKVFTKLDLRKGYHQVPVHPEDIAKIAIITPFGLFEYVRMPFGLRNAGQTFQRLMDRVLQGLDYVFIYLDDVLIASPDKESHWRHLNEVFQRLKEAGLVLNTSKCVFAVPVIDFLGHKVTAVGISPLKSRVQAVQDFPPLKTNKQLLSFLGMINFYRRFLPMVAKVFKPLTDNLRGGQAAAVEWSLAMVSAFQEAKQMLCKAACLAHPDVGAELSLAVDASDSHIGAVLQQSSPFGPQPLAFFSRKLEPAQSRYSTFDRELLACYEAVKHFRWSLEGRPFYILTDHKPLTYALAKAADAWSARQQRHLSMVAEYTTDIRHIAGTDNVVADTLSRPALAAVAATEGLDYAAMAADQVKCAETADLVNSSSLEIVSVFVNGYRLLCNVSTAVPRPVVPTGWRRAVFDSVHSLAHPGVRATKRMITARFVWKKCSSDVAEWCKCCVGCARGKPGGTQAAPVEPIDIPAERFSHVHCDLVGPLPPSAHGHTHILARFGAPSKITTDRCVQFTSATWAGMCQQLGAQHLRTSAYHPQSNGLVERLHRQLKEALKSRECGSQWHEHLPWVLLGIRAAPKERAGVSAAEAVYGKPVALPGQFWPAAEVEARPIIPPTVKPSEGPTATPEVSSGLVFVRRPHKRPAGPFYDGLYRVLEEKDKLVLVQMGQIQDWVSRDRIKPYLGRDSPQPAGRRARGRPKKK
jgi:transposase InsO family protein